MGDVLDQPGRNDHGRHQRHRHEERGHRDREGRSREAQGDPEKDRHARADKPNSRQRPGSRSQSPRDRKRRQGDRGESNEGDGKASHRSRRHSHTPSALPHGARHLKSSDRLMFEPLLARYLETEKQLALHGLRDDEKESRWKRFVDRWNHHGLADSWYAPQMFLSVARAKQTQALTLTQPQLQQESDSDDYGPALPPEAHQHQRKPARATLPTLDDLRERRELVDEERDAQRTADRAARRLARQADRKEERERLEELVPRAAAGTRERQLEKRRALNDKMRSFRDKSPGPAEVDDNELLGGGGGTSDVHEYKRMVATAQKKRSEWEVRREEEQRARQAELDERREQYRAREAEKVEMLRALARQRFG